MEDARRDKVIGHPLDAQVRLTAGGDTFDFLKDIEGELGDIFICSGVAVIEGDGPYMESEEFSKLRIEVVRAPGEKCPRCWHYSVNIGSNPAHPEVCARCAKQLD